MGFFNFRSNKNENNVSTNPVKLEEIADKIYNLSTQTSLPIIVEKHSQNWVDYKNDDGEEYLIYLEQLYNNSPTHQAIVDTKTLMMNGTGFEYNKDIPVEDRIELERILNFADGVKDLHTITGELFKDSQLYGAFCLEIIWSTDFTKINKITRINPKNIKSGKFYEGKVRNYYYSEDFEDRRKDVVPISAFNVSNKTDHRQLLYVPNQKVSNNYYGEPSYLASCNWINLEAQTGLFYKSLLENGFNPSLIIKFYSSNETSEQRDEKMRALKRSFAGIKNSGKVMTIFAKNKETAPDIEPINVSALDKQYTVIADQIVTKILTGHRVTTPELFGIAVPGKLGTADFSVQVKAFINFVISPEQRKMEALLNKLLKINGLDVELKITQTEL